MGLQWRGCQLESPNMVSPANRPSGRRDNCAETASVTAGLLGATSRGPVCGVYQGGLVTTPRGMSLGTPESMFGLGSRGRSRVDLTPIGARNPSCSSV